MMISKKLKLSYEGKLLTAFILVGILMDLAIPKVASAKEKQQIVVFPEITLEQQNMQAETGLQDKPSTIKVTSPGLSENQSNETPGIPQIIKIAPLVPPKKVMTITATAYNSLAKQCDSTPCVAAKGFNLCEHNSEDVIAANFLPMGAKVRFPDLYGDKVFTVVDRMHPRYYYRVDFWKKEFSDAKKFGVKRVKIEVL